jgi:hypothetical protein
LTDTNSIFFNTGRNINHGAFCNKLFDF